MVAAGLDYDTEVLRTYNCYLSQLRMRIEMSFGRLTTKWRLLRKTLNYKLEKNAKIVRVCTKLHNYCIHMAQQDGGGRSGVIEGGDFDPIEYGIKWMTGVGNQHSSNGYLETSPLDDTTDGAVLFPLAGSATLRIYRQGYCFSRLAAPRPYHRA